MRSCEFVAFVVAAAAATVVAGCRASGRDANSGPAQTGEPSASALSIEPSGGGPLTASSGRPAASPRPANFWLETDCADWGSHTWEGTLLGGSVECFHRLRPAMHRPNGRFDFKFRVLEEGTWGFAIAPSGEGKGPSIGLEYARESFRLVEYPSRRVLSESPRPNGLGRDWHDLRVLRTTDRLVVHLDRTPLVAYEVRQLIGPTGFWVVPKARIQVGFVVGADLNEGEVAEAMAVPLGWPAPQKPVAVAEQTDLERLVAQQKPGKPEGKATEYRVALASNDGHYLGIMRTGSYLSYVTHDFGPGGTAYDHLDAASDLKLVDINGGELQPGDPVFLKNAGLYLTFVAGDPPKLTALPAPSDGARWHLYSGQLKGRRAGEFTPPARGIHSVLLRAPNGDFLTPCDQHQCKAPPEAAGLRPVNPGSSTTLYWTRDPFAKASEGNPAWVSTAVWAIWPVVDCIHKPSKKRLSCATVPAMSGYLLPEE